MEGFHAKMKASTPTQKSFNAHKIRRIAPILMILTKSSAAARKNLKIFVCVVAVAERRVRRPNVDARTPNSRKRRRRRVVDVDVDVISKTYQNE